MQFSWVQQLRLPTAVVVMRRCRVVVFETPEVIEKTGWGAQRHTTSHDAGLTGTADCCMQGDACLTYDMLPNWKLRPRNCLRKGDDGRARDSCIGAGDDNSPAERPLYRQDCTQCSARNALAAASCCRHRVTRYLPNIAGAASTAASISYIKKLLLLLLLLLL